MRQFLYKLQGTCTKIKYLSVPPGFKLSKRIKNLTVTIDCNYCLSAHVFLNNEEIKGGIKTMTIEYKITLYFDAADNSS